MLEHVLTPEAISGFGLPWHVTRLRCRAEYTFAGCSSNMTEAPKSAHSLARVTVIHSYAVTRWMAAEAYEIHCEAHTKAETATSSKK